MEKPSRYQRANAYATTSIVLMNVSGLVLALTVASHWLPLLFVFFCITAIWLTFFITACVIFDRIGKGH